MRSLSDVHEVDALQKNKILGGNDNESRSVREDVPLAIKVRHKTKESNLLSFEFLSVYSLQEIVHDGQA